MSNLRYILFVYLLTCCSQLLAQTGFKIGGGITSINRKSVADIDDRSIVNFHLGAVTNFELGQSSFAIEYLISKKGGGENLSQTVVHRSGTATSTLVGFQKNVLYNFEMPMLWTAPLGNKINVELGPSISVRLYGVRVSKYNYTFTNSGGAQTFKISDRTWLGNKDAFPNFEKDETTYVYEDHRLNNKPIKSLDVGVNVGLTFGSDDVVIGIRYYRGFRDLYNNSYYSPNDSVEKNFNSAILMSFTFF